LCDTAGAGLPEGLHHFRGERRGAEQINPAPASDGWRGEGGGTGAGREAQARAGLAHAGQRQDVHDDQDGGDAFPRAGSGQADGAADDRPQRAGRPDAQEPGGAGVGESGTRQQHPAAERAAEERLPGHHRDDDPQVPRHAGGP
jgi:hypothetical protein